jgi:hypothetical protein
VVSESGDAVSRRGASASNRTERFVQLLTKQFRFSKQGRIGIRSGGSAGTMRRLGAATSRSSSIRRFMQKGVEHQSVGAASRKLPNRGLVALEDSCNS